MLFVRWYGYGSKPIGSLLNFRKMKPPFWRSFPGFITGSCPVLSQCYMMPRAVRLLPSCSMGTARRIWFPCWAQPAKQPTFGSASIWFSRCPRICWCLRLLGRNPRKYGGVALKCYNFWEGHMVPCKENISWTETPKAGDTQAETNWFELTAFHKEEELWILQWSLVAWKLDVSLGYPLGGCDRQQTMTLSQN